MRYLTYLGIALAVHTVFVGYFAHEFSVLLSERLDVLASALDIRR